MVDIITAESLASYLRDDTLVASPSLAQVVELTNALLTEEWATPVDPIPVKITLLALNVAARAWVYDPSTANLESLSRTSDDGSRTEKYRTAIENSSVYLTESEEALLNGRKARRSIRLTIYGTTP